MSNMTVGEAFQVQGYHEQASFTVSLGCLVENGFDVGLETYPIFDEKYREALNGKILRHYWMREVGQETPALFRFMLRRKMMEIMPYYNELYKSTILEINPLANQIVTTEATTERQQDDKRDNVHHEDVTASSTAASSSTGSARTLVSQTPQMQLSGHDDYATNITDTSNTAETSSRSDDGSTRKLTENDVMASNAHEDYVQRVTGLVGITGAKAITEFREALINVDLMVIDELAPLFFGIYSKSNNLL